MKLVCFTCARAKNMLGLYFIGRDGKIERRPKELEEAPTVEAHRARNHRVKEVPDETPTCGPRGIFEN